MPYTAIPNFTDGNILSAAALNTLSSNQAFLYGVANNANAPFNSYRKVIFNIDENDMIWYIRHRVPWLHWRINCAANWNRARIWYNGVKLGDAPISTTWSGAYNLSSWAGLPDLLGAWASGQSYSDDVDSDNDDGHKVTQGGQTYRCKVAHTSAAGNQPGIGGTWTTYWDLLTLPSIGSICQAWVHVNCSGNQEIGIEYIIETDSSSF
jgi:hypothetical protein